MHLDAALFGDLEHGDELVGYAGDIPIDTGEWNLQAFYVLKKRKELYEHLRARKLQMVPAQRTGTKIVWKLVSEYAQKNIPEEAAAED